MNKATTKKRNIAILGSTGSIGTQAVEIIRDNRDRFVAYALTANRNADLLIAQARLLEPEIVVIADEELYPKVKNALKDLPIKVWTGAQAISDAAAATDIDIVLTAMVGYAGLAPTLAAIEARKVVALANKETLVVAGSLIRSLATKANSPIIPVDSEHSAIAQCLVGEHNSIEKIILTASGGPFLHRTKKELASVTPEQALKHPNWSMGAKVTIDSASMMNKGFEMIEAHWLFDVKPSEIEIVVHPESIVHSMVQFADGSIKAQLGLPDMRLPISYALGLTDRVPNSYPRVDFTARPLTFLEPDLERFPNLTLAYEAVKLGGTAACALNAANEIAVEAFLQGRVPFLRMSDILEATMHHHTHIADPSLEDLIATDLEARHFASSKIPL